MMMFLSISFSPITVMMMWHGIWNFMFITILAGESSKGRQRIGAFVRWSGRA